jgi:protein-tyrosine phosphatase
MTHILLVCRGNLCRSPMAWSITRTLLAPTPLAPQLHLASAGTHAGLAPAHTDPRASAALVRHGYAPGRMRSRNVQPHDFERFDQILAMDHSNLTDLLHRCPDAHRHKLGLFLRYAPDLSTTEIPDPYYGGLPGFERVLHLCEAGARGLLAHWRARQGD